MCGLHAYRSEGLLKRSLRVVISFTMAALLMSVAAAPCHLQGIPRCQGRPCLDSWTGCICRIDVLRAFTALIIGMVTPSMSAAP